MTRSERIRVACERFAEGRPDGMAETVDQGIEAALDAALADVGGLDGLDEQGRALVAVAVAVITLIGTVAVHSARTPKSGESGVSTPGSDGERDPDTPAAQLAVVVADRERLRDALRWIAAHTPPDSPTGGEARRALRESEAEDE